MESVLSIGLIKGAGSTNKKDFLSEVFLLKNGLFSL